MSKLADAIDATYTGKVFMVPYGQEAFVVDKEVKEIGNPVVAKEVRLGVKFEIKARVKSEEEYRYAVDKCRRALIEEAFGEFRPLIIRMHNLLANHDLDGARRLLNELEIEMFY